MAKKGIFVTDKQLGTIWSALDTGWERLDMCDPDDEQLEVDEDGEESGVAAEKKEIWEAIQLVNRLRKRVK